LRSCLLLLQDSSLPPLSPSSSSSCPLPRAPTSALSPYTTLFRSAVRRGPARGRDARGRALVLRDQREDHVVPGRVRGHRVLGQVDRKSTRLNSSHVSISYAVFCLKQKKRTRHRTRSQEGPTASGY